VTAIAAVELQGAQLEEGANITFSGCKTNSFGCSFSDASVESRICLRQTTILRAMRGKCFEEEWQSGRQCEHYLF
jgi:hypothetical protein